MLNAQQQQTFEYLFGLFDKTGNGSIAENDFIKAFEGIKAASSADKAAKIDKAARRWYLSLSVFGDENKDKQLSKAEWLKWAEGFAEDVQDAEISRKYGHFVDAVFASIAGDDDTISADEYALWFHSFGLVGNAAAIFKQMDGNGNGTISKDEFNNLFLAFVKGNILVTGHQLFGKTTTVLQFIEDKINHYANLIVKGQDKVDDIAAGQLDIYLTLRRALKGTRTSQDLGRLDAINDFLQLTGHLAPGQSFLKS